MSLLGGLRQLSAGLGKIAKTNEGKKGAPGSPPLYSAEYRALLDEIAKLLIASAEIVAKRKDGTEHRFRLAEVELYAFADGVYEDRFTHRDAQQSVLGTWYFHKKGGSFKNGSFKGLDVTFGSSDFSGGALIRSIVAIPDGKVTEGPSLVVDALLDATGMKTIADLVGAKDGILFIDSSFAVGGEERQGASLLRIVDAPLPGAASVRTAPRVGLVPREASDLMFAGRLLRFIRSDIKLAKQRAGIIAALLAEGTTSPEAQKLTGGTAKNIEAIQQVLQGIKNGSHTNVASDAGGKDGGVLNGDVMQTEIIAAIVGWASLQGWL